MTARPARTWLVTGGAGFIGSSFVRRALERHPDLGVRNLDKLTYAGNRANLEGLAPGRHELVVGDICDPRAVASAMRGVELAINFAAETHVDRSLMDALSFVRTDVEGVFVLCEAARAAGLRLFVQISTDEVYGSRLEGAFQESDACNPRNPYAASKLGGDRLASAYFETHGLPVIVSRGSNTYGPRQHPEKVIPLFITNALMDRELPLYGDGLNVRDWTHVEDHCDALLHLIEHGRPGETYNLAAGQARTNKEMAHAILACLGKPASLVRHVRDRQGHDRRYAVDTSKLKALGWKPRWDFERGLEATVEWYRSNPDWWRPVRDPEFESYYARQYGGR